MKAYAIQVNLDGENGTHSDEKDTPEEILQLVAEVLGRDNTDDLDPPSEDPSTPTIINADNGVIMYGRNPYIPMAS